MVLEDNPSIREGYRNILQKTAATFKTKAIIEVFATPDEAVKRLMDPVRRSFDLFFTDIDLTGNPKPDKAGLNFAQFARSIMPDVPIVGCSGYFADADLSAAEKSIFDQWWPKGSNISQLTKMFNDVMGLAIKHKESSIAVPSNGDCDSVDMIDTPTTNEDFQNSGYRMDTISPNANNGYKKPFTLWVKQSDEGCELEVVGCSALMAWGDDFEQALEVLDELIEGYKSLLDVPDETLSTPMLKARDFIRKITDHT
jgi:CheY-like chemotaxis protein